MKKNKGFTLIELLVVMAIIAVLAALSLTGLSAARRAARDTQRKSDLSQYRSMLEAYASSSGDKYPGYTSYPQTLPSMIATGGLLVNYATGMLNDPQTTTATCTNLTTTTHGYCYYADGATAGASSLNYVIFNSLEGGSFWVVCSNGKSGVFASQPATAVCPI